MTAAGAAQGPAVAVGIDLGTSGVRAAAVSAAGRPLAVAGWRLPRPEDLRDPAVWLTGTAAALAALARAVPLGGVARVAVDGTSGSLVAVDDDLRPVGAALMYADPVTDRAVTDRIAAAAPPDSPARGGGSGLARAVVLAARAGAARVLHQADYVAAHLAGRLLPTDETNALKTGYDPVARGWGDWIAAAGLDPRVLPPVRPAGAPLAPVGDLGRAWGLPAVAVIHAGTTDGCAAFLATGADRAGDGVTSLGSTLVLKLLSPCPVFDAASGVYSHRIGAVWLAGGASNSGGGVLEALFGRAALAALDAGLRPLAPTGLDYYPLLRPGERFPVCDPDLPPRLAPRPADPARFHQGVIEGLAAIEAQGYRRLADLGAPPVRSVRSVGGGAAARGYGAIRAARLGVPMLPALSPEAAVGAARLALFEGVGPG